MALSVPNSLAASGSCRTLSRPCHQSPLPPHSSNHKDRAPTNPSPEAMATVGLQSSFTPFIPTWPQRQPPTHWWSSKSRRAHGSLEAWLSRRALSLNRGEGSAGQLAVTPLPLPRQLDRHLRASPGVPETLALLSTACRAHGRVSPLGLPAGWEGRESCQLPQSYIQNLKPTKPGRLP